MYQTTVKGLAALQEAVTRVGVLWSPPPDLTISEWADAQRRLSPESSAEPGKWYTSRAEYQRGIMDAFSDPSVELIVCMTSAQVGKTEMLNNVVGYYVDQDPSPMLVVQPNRTPMAEAWSKDRLAPMLRDTPCLRGKVKDPRSRDSGNTILHKTFAGGHITVAGANSPADLASRPVRIVLCDEVDRYDRSAATEGDPVNLAFKRTANFWNRKRALFSTPTIHGKSRIEDAFEQSDKRRFLIPCPKCGETQFLVWQQVKWDGQPRTAQYECLFCKGRWNDGERRRAIGLGQWIPTAPFNGIAGFHLNAIYSPWTRLAELASQWVESYKIPEQHQVFVNTVLGETWQQRGDAPEWQRLYDRREEYAMGTVPAGVLFLTAGADVQMDRIEVQVVGWGRGKESWLVDYVVLDGHTSQSQVWERLTEITSQTYPHASGADLGIIRLAIDSGAVTQRVYDWVRSQAPGRVIAVKGEAGGVAPIWLGKAVDVTSRGKTIKRGMRPWHVATAMLKSEFYGWLRLEKPTEESGEAFQPGYCHFPELPEEFFKQVTSEQLVTKVVKGYRQSHWELIPNRRNEALDNRVYARAAAAHYGIDRFRDHQWQEFEKMLGVAVKRAQPKPPEPEVPKPTAEPRRREGSWLGDRGKNWLR